MICKHCNQEVPSSEIERRKKKKSDLIKQARIEAKSRGEQVGALKKYDRNKIIELRKLGYSIRKIAKEVGCSISPVVDTLKDLK